MVYRTSSKTVLLTIIAIVGPAAIFHRHCLAETTSRGAFGGYNSLGWNQQWSGSVPLDGAPQKKKDPITPPPAEKPVNKMTIFDLRIEIVKLRTQIKEVSSELDKVRKELAQRPPASKNISSPASSSNGDWTSLSREQRTQFDLAVAAYEHAHVRHIDELQKELQRVSRAQPGTTDYKDRTQRMKQLRTSITDLKERKAMLPPEIIEDGLGTPPVGWQNMKIVQVLDANRCIVAATRGERRFMLYGPTSGMVDGEMVSLENKLMMVDETDSYTSVLGAKITLRSMRPLYLEVLKALDAWARSGYPPIKPAGTPAQSDTASTK